MRAIFSREILICMELILNKNRFKKQDMTKYLLKNISIVNEGATNVGDVLIANNRIEKIAGEIGVRYAVTEIDCTGKHLLPGAIDDQVHFREPGLTHKGTIYTESKAAVAGGVTSFMEMPNTIPNTLSQELLDNKYVIASQTSLTNYSFFMGVSNNNAAEALKTNKKKKIYAELKFS